MDTLALWQHPPGPNIGNTAVMTATAATAELSAERLLSTYFSVPFPAMRRLLFSLLWLVLASLLAGLDAWAADTVPLAELAKPGRVLLLRHAHAPGTGDPPNFRLDDCSTQRNLDAAGRAQAAALGERLAQAGVAHAKVYSSEWCRCLQTARLLGLGAVEALPALNSFYGRPRQRDIVIAALRSFLAALPADAPPMVLVTHQLTITALTGEGTPSGGGSLFELSGSGAPRRLGAIQGN